MNIFLENLTIVCKKDGVRAHEIQSTNQQITLRTFFLLHQKKNFYPSRSYHHLNWIVPIAEIFSRCSVIERNI